MALLPCGAGDLVACQPLGRTLRVPWARRCHWTNLTPYKRSRMPRLRKPGFSSRFRSTSRNPSFQRHAELQGFDLALVRSRVVSVGGPVSEPADAPGPFEVMLAASSSERLVSSSNSLVRSTGGTFELTGVEPGALRPGYANRPDTPLQLTIPIPTISKSCLSRRGALRDESFSPRVVRCRRVVRWSYSAGTDSAPL